jgi:oligoendopeptidase F
MKNHDAPGSRQSWDLSAFFSRFDGPEYRAAKAALRASIAELLPQASALPALGAGTESPTAKAAGIPAWRDVFLLTEQAGAQIAHLFCYIGCLAATHASDEAIQAEEADLEVISAELSKVQAQFLRGLRSVDDATFKKLLAEPALAGATHSLQRLRAEAKYQMPVEQEELAADLGVSGFRAWGRLYDTLTGKMTFEMRHADGRTETIPMAQRRSLLAHPDRAIRRAAFEGGAKVWAANVDTCAAVVNALAGTRHALYARRGREHFLDAPLHDGALSRDTIDAMFAAVSANYTLPRRVLKLGAKLQGTPGLAWYDLEAPRPLDPVPPISWDDAVNQVQAAFDAAYPSLGNYFRGMVERRWIESEKRPNKRNGAFQTGSPVLGEERIYMTFSDTMTDVITLAHEAGHAWHTHLLRQLRPCAQEYPATLAETASTFAEKIFIGGLLTDPKLSLSRRAFLLDATTNQIPTYLLNIPVRYLFEKRFYEERRQGVVSPTRLNELMTAAQREVYGDTLQADGVDPTMWASKLHFALTGLSFYNFPYTFGFLLSQALFAEFSREGASFLPRYEAFLLATGSASCEDAVLNTLGWNIRDERFWSNAIAACEVPIRAFEEIVAARGR